MAVSTAAAWTNTTEVQVVTGPVRLTKVEIDILPAASAASFFQAYNLFDSTPGTTAPDVQCRIPPFATVSGKSRLELVFPGGLYFETGLSWFVATASAGGTAATTHAPTRVSVYYAIGN